MATKHRTDRISLPVMQACVEGCDACCGVVACHEWEFQRVQTYVKQQGLQPLRQGITCPWFQGGKCAVYAVRPFVCRYFGHVPEMECKHGLNVNVSPEEQERIDRIYRKEGTGDFWFLHQMLGDGWEKEMAKDAPECQ